MNYGEICLYTIPAVILLSYVVKRIINSLGNTTTVYDNGQKKKILKSELGSAIRIIFFYIFCICIIFHELAHWTMCKIFGVEVSEVVLFRVNRTPDDTTSPPKKDHGKNIAADLGFGGYVLLKKPINSVLANFFVSVGPLIINGLLVALIWFFHPHLVGTLWYPLFMYLGFGLALGTMPSGGDMKAFSHSLAQSPGRGLLEMILLILFIWITYSLFAVWYVEGWIAAFIIGGVLLFFILYARHLNQSTNQRWRPPRI